MNEKIKDSLTEQQKLILAIKYPDDDFDITIMDWLNYTIKQSIPSNTKCPVSYAIDEPLNEIAVHGNVVFYKEVSNGYYWDAVVVEDRPDTYISKVIKDPTWLDVCVVATEAIQQVEDYDHSFLEGIHEVESDDSLQVYTFDLGS